jgi:hypothetical protein
LVAGQIVDYEPPTNCATRLWKSLAGTWLSESRRKLDAFS